MRYLLPLWLPHEVRLRLSALHKSGFCFPDQIKMKSTFRPGKTAGWCCCFWHCWLIETVPPPPASSRFRCRSGFRSSPLFELCRQAFFRLAKAERYPHFEARLFLRRWGRVVGHLVGRRTTERKAVFFSWEDE